MGAKTTKGTIDLSLSLSLSLSPTNLCSALPPPSSSWELELSKGAQQKIKQARETICIYFNQPIRIPEDFRYNSLSSRGVSHTLLATGLTWYVSALFVCTKPELSTNTSRNQTHEMAAVKSRLSNNDSKFKPQFLFTWLLISFDHVYTTCEYNSEVKLITPFSGRTPGHSPRRAHLNSLARLIVAGANGWECRNLQNPEMALSPTSGRQTYSQNLMMSIHRSWWMFLVVVFHRNAIKLHIWFNLFSQVWGIPQTEHLQIWHDLTTGSAFSQRSQSA